METTCARARKAMVDGDSTPEIEAHLAQCPECADIGAIAAFFRAATDERPAAGPPRTETRAERPAIADLASAEPVTTDVTPAGSATTPFDPIALASTELADTRPAARRPGAGPVLGQQILHYTIVEALGRGGQGAVFKATERDVPGSVVALKIVRSSPASLKEVRAKPITHPNVVRINHTAVYGELRLVEMEYVDGGTLADRLTPDGKGAGRPPLTRPEAKSVFLGVLAGIEAVHAAGILHLDLKPLNILLRRDLQPVVTDFGMSVGAGSRVLGCTRGWSAPEVERGEQPDPRADVYSLGALLEALFPDPGAALTDVITRAEAARREQRYPDVASLRAAFEEALRRDAAPAVPPENPLAPAPAPPPVDAPSQQREPLAGPRARRSVLLILAVVLVGVAAAIGWGNAPASRDAEPARESPPPVASALEPPAPSTPPTAAPAASPRPSAHRPPPPPRPPASSPPALPADPPKLKYPGVL